MASPCRCRMYPGSRRRSCSGRPCCRTSPTGCSRCQQGRCNRWLARTVRLSRLAPLYHRSCRTRTGSLTRTRLTRSRTSRMRCSTNLARRSRCWARSFEQLPLRRTVLPVRPLRKRGKARLFFAGAIVAPYSNGSATKRIQVGCSCRIRRGNARSLLVNSPKRQSSPQRLGLEFKVHPPTAASCTVDK